ncbi:transporter substrate-binding domain-containing protein [Noviherbaspirillum galbum]|uniref:Transporter substrate-binding domain-containing protein n=1 Tax=Noviherbaspirillum galbum TaxID=2709383 RepID=A0A6B3SUS5_9BURK|nr:transporter substrate-binding domain-containing protein [Noviherbaspirillum galbum]NEX64790.1 transporter substrate-binding domain-containing protein [Noviherbaspirillum galbum]
MKFETLFQKIAFISLLLFAQVVSAEQFKPSKALEQIQKRGTLRVGVKTDFRPYNWLDAKGEVIGFESDLAQLLSDRLGVKLQKVSITTENRFQKLELGDVDILIATVGDTAARRQIAAAVEPGYSETGVNVLFHPQQAVDTWEKTRGSTICALQGSYFNKPMAERYLLKLQVYKTVRDAQLALKDGQCIGFLYATGALKNTLKQPDWSAYKMPLPQALVTPMSVFLARSERGSELDVKIGDLLAELHRTGWLIENERKWGIDISDWMLKQKELWAHQDATGKYTCTRNDSGLWSANCRSAEYVSSAEVQGLQAVGLWFKEQTGIDLNIVYDPYDRKQFAQGVLYTMLLVASSVAISLMLGIAVAVAIDGKTSWWTRAIAAAMAYGRMTPPLLMMYLIFFGVGGWLMHEFGIKLPAFPIAAFCLGYYTAGLIMSAFLEAARHIRTYRPAFRLSFHNLSQTAEFSSWPIKQALINLTKQTMIASAIAIPELLSASSLLIAEKGNIFLIMTVLLLTFYIITNLWTALFNIAERMLLARVALHAH